MTTRTNARARNTMRDAREYTSHDVINDDERAMMNAHNDANDTRDAMTREYGNVLYSTHDDATNDDATITRARIARKLTKRDRALLRKIARDENSNVAHEHNTRWHDVVFDVRVLQRANIEYKIVE